MNAALVSILVPAYNEEDCIGRSLERAAAAPLPAGMAREFIVVDDGSTDGSAEVLNCAEARYNGLITVIRHPRRRGKGAAVRTALEHARGEITIIQDADLEYDPADYPRLLAPILAGQADAVYGSRFLAADERRVLPRALTARGRFITRVSSLASGLAISDVAAGLKAFRTSLAQSIPLRSEGYGFECELATKLARRHLRVFEVPVSYSPRTREEGGKRSAGDTLAMAVAALRFAFTRDIYKSSGPEILENLSGAPRFNRWMADTIRHYVGKRVLEIGSGIGNLTRQLAPGRSAYVASDYDPEHLARLAARIEHRPYLSVCRCDLTDPGDFKAYAGTMDSVVCLNVLEHVEDDLLGLRNIHSALRRGGRAIILVPHDQKIFGTLDEVLGHYRRYSHEQLRDVMERAGFRVEQILEFNRVSRPAWNFSGRVLKKKTLSPVQLRLFDKTVWFWRRFDRYLPWPPTSIIAIGEKIQG